MRIHGTLVSGQVSGAAQVASLWIGLLVLPVSITDSTQVLAAFDDSTANNWVYHTSIGFFASSGAIDQIASADRRIIDVRSRRRFGETDQLWLATQNKTLIDGTAGGNVSLAVTFRFLFRETRG